MMRFCHPLSQKHGNAGYNILQKFIYLTYMTGYGKNDGQNLKKKFSPQSQLLTRIVRIADASGCFLLLTCRKITEFSLSNGYIHLLYILPILSIVSDS